MSTTKINLGKVALTPKGEWSAGTTYERLDMFYDKIPFKIYSNVAYYYS